MDAVVFVVNRENGLTSLSLEQVERICSGRIEAWEQVGVPFEQRIRLHMLRPDSGSVKVVQARAMHGKGYTSARVEHEVVRDVVNAVAADPLTLGFGGMGYISTTEILSLRADATSPPVLPTPETIRDREYPLAHYLYLYFAGEPVGLARDFLLFVVSPAGQDVVRQSGTGAVALPIRAPDG
jgi:phosphate transport system substrate-binding protein